MLAVVGREYTTPNELKAGAFENKKGVPRWHHPTRIAKDNIWIIGAIDTLYGALELEGPFYGTT